MLLGGSQKCGTSVGEEVYGSLCGESGKGVLGEQENDLAQRGKRIREHPLLLKLNNLFCSFFIKCGKICIT